MEQGQKLKEQLKEERERRELNLTAQPLTEEELVRCDSSFKKNNGLIRKLKSIALKEKDTLCAEIRKVNQTKVRGLEGAKKSDRGSLVCE